VESTLRKREQWRADLRRASRRRVFRWAAAAFVVAAILYVAGVPALRYMGYLRYPVKLGSSARWELVRIADDRESAEIRVDECRARFDRADVKRVGRDARLTVLTRAYESVVTAPCPSFADMPAHLVEFGFVLPSDGRVLDESYDPDPTREQFD
jgi:hypothetical protein